MGASIGIFIISITLFALISCGEIHRCETFQNLQFFEDQIFSQNGEDGVLLALLDVIIPRSMYYVEFGVESGMECNTRILRERMGFTGLLMDGGFENPDINLRREFITESNILEIFQKYSVPNDFDVLSVDVDMFDWWILTRILREGYRPRIIIVEVNPTLCLDRGNFRNEFTSTNAIPLTVVHPKNTNQSVWDLTRYAGANPLAYQRLGHRFGYDMVYCERCGVNCFLVLRSALPEQCSNVFEHKLPKISYPCYGGKLTGHLYPGHKVDDLQRNAVRMDEAMLDTVLATGVGKVSEVPIESSHACSAAYPEWGQDWCTFLFAPSRPSSNPSPGPSPSLRYTQMGDGSEVTGFGGDTDTDTGPEEANELALQATKAFRRGDVAAALALFKRALLALATQGECLSQHRSEAQCAAIAHVFYNIAVTTLRSHPSPTAPPLPDAQDPVASSDSKKKGIDLLAEVLNHLLSASFHDRKDTRISALLKFVEFLSNIDVEEVVERRYAQVSFDIEVTTASGIGLKGLVVGAGACNDGDARAAAACARLGLGPDPGACDVVRTALRGQLRQHVFGEAPFHLQPFLTCGLQHCTHDGAAGTPPSEGKSSIAPVPECLVPLVSSKLSKRCMGSSSATAEAPLSVVVMGPPSGGLDAAVGMLRRNVVVGGAAGVRAGDGGSVEKGNDAALIEEALRINAALLQAVGCGPGDQALLLGPSWLRHRPHGGDISDEGREPAPESDVNASVGLATEGARLSDVCETGIAAMASGVVVPSLKAVRASQSLAEAMFVAAKVHTRKQQDQQQQQQRHPESCSATAGRPVHVYGGTEFAFTLREWEDPLGAVAAAAAATSSQSTPFLFVFVLAPPAVTVTYLQHTLGVDPVEGRKMWSRAVGAALASLEGQQPVVVVEGVEFLRRANAASLASDFKAILSGLGASMPDASCAFAVDKEADKEVEKEADADARDAGSDGWGQRHHVSPGGSGGDGEQGEDGLDACYRDLVAVTKRRGASLPRQCSGIDG